MKATRTSGIHDWELLVGDDQELAIRGTVHYAITPGEKMVRYYPDGSGYPGSPPEIEFWGAMISEIVLTLEMMDFKLGIPEGLAEEAFAQTSEELTEHIFAEHGEPERDE
jgi:hypothetical protein